MNGNLGRSLGAPSCEMEIYFSVDVETDGPIPGPYSMLAVAIVVAGSFDGISFKRTHDFGASFYRELRPISPHFQEEALAVNRLDRQMLLDRGCEPAVAMREAAEWILLHAGNATPILVAYPLGFDWAWLYWYFVRFNNGDSPFRHSLAFDIKTAYAVKAQIPIAKAGRSKVYSALKSSRLHSHNALDDAMEQADIFANLFEWTGMENGIRDLSKHASSPVK